MFVLNRSVRLPNSTDVFDAERGLVQCYDVLEVTHHSGDHNAWKLSRMTHMPECMHAKMTSAKFQDKECPVNNALDKKKNLITGQCDS